MKKKTKMDAIENQKPEATSTSPSVIGEAEVKACFDHLQAIGHVLAPYAVTLTAAQRKSATRLRKGGDKVIPLMSRVATNVGVGGAAFDIDAMQRQVELANTLLPLLTSAKTLTDTLADTVLAANSKAWASATTLHGVLKRMSKDKPSMRRDMEVVSAVFARKPRATKKGAAPSADAPKAEPQAEATPEVEPAKAQPQQAPAA
jgi:hypothetical protein